MWHTATINVSALPIVIQTVNPCIERIMPVIARTMSQVEAKEIVQQLLDTRPPFELQLPTSLLQLERTHL
jgi:hypothetical protein